MKTNNYIYKFWNHLKTVLKHKRWVFHYCRIAGITWQGLIHDLSKFSPIEFFEGVKYYDGTRSPIDVCKEHNDYSKAWLRHKGKNKHHYEYWQDDFINCSTREIEMPTKYKKEMLCDYLGAGRAYMSNMNKEFTFADELQWWRNKKHKNPNYNKFDFQFLDFCFMELAKLEKLWGYEEAERAIPMVIIKAFSRIIVTKAREAN